MSLFVNDTRPALTGTCQTTDPATKVTSGANLTGASLSIVIRRADGTTLTKTGAIVTATAGTWSYTWAAGDLSVPGNYTVKVVVTYSDAGVQTFGPAEFYVNP